jgi:hypothetical protein
MKSQFLSFGLACFALSGGLAAQDNPPANAAPAAKTTGTSSSSRPERRNNSDTTNAVYVRRFSLGVSLSVLGLPPIRTGDTTNTVNTNAVTSIVTEYKSNAESSRIGYGLNGQIAVTDRFAVAFGAFLRRVGYALDTTTTTNVTGFVNGVQGITTSSVNVHNDTRTRVLNVPFMLRYYSKGRREPGPRWFAEGGGAFQTLLSPRSTFSTTDAVGNFACCTTSTSHFAHRSVFGVEGGAGVQLIDPVGIRVVPEVRYTRWMNPLIDDTSAHNQRNQVEASLSLSF